MLNFEITKSNYFLNNFSIRVSFGHLYKKMKTMNDLQMRLLKFSTGVFKVMTALPYNVDIRDNKNQLIRSSSSPGANYGEAQSASSKKDFIYKIGAVLKELRESLYWLLFFKEIYPKTRNLNCSPLKGMSW
jgi:four helix bundle protein